jgi:hypothetical protein
VPAPHVKRGSTGRIVGRAANGKDDSLVESIAHVFERPIAFLAMLVCREGGIEGAVELE